MLAASPSASARTAPPASRTRARQRVAPPSTPTYHAALGMRRLAAPNVRRRQEPRLACLAFVSGASSRSKSDILARWRRRPAPRTPKLTLSLGRVAFYFHAADSPPRQARPGAHPTAMKRPLVHIVGAGAAGLAAARALAADGRRDVVMHECAPYPGGRRRTFHDDALGLDFDTGNFPLISSWTASLSLIEAIGARGEWQEDAEPGVAFADFATGERWRLRPNLGRAPWWLLSGKRRGHGLRFSDFWAARRLFSAPPGATVASVAPGEPGVRQIVAPADPGRAQCSAGDGVGRARRLCTARDPPCRRRRNAGSHARERLRPRLRGAARAQYSAPRRGAPVRAAPRGARFRAGAADVARVRT